jgi:outer membrane lipopolysaccharide assembly protein LptE/RlpB
MIKTRNAGLMLTAAALLLAAAACGYRLRGTGTSLPAGIKSVSVPVFKNLSGRYELDVKLTRAVIDELVGRGRLRLEADASRADALLEGECVSFAAVPTAFTAQGRPDRYNITVTANARLRARESGSVIFAAEGFKFIEEYEVPEGADFESVQTEAIDRIAPKFARSLVAAMLEGF